VTDQQDSSTPSTVIPLPANSRSAVSASVPLSQSSPLPSRVTFDRTELKILLGLYGRKVADGEWRDYALDFLKDRAVFSIFRRSTEYPIYRIEKDPKLAARQGAYSVVSSAGRILKRGHELARVVTVIDKPVRLIG
jgi:Protein of unknown function (DUF2794)